MPKANPIRILADQTAKKVDPVAKIAVTIGDLWEGITSFKIAQNDAKVAWEKAREATFGKRGDICIALGEAAANGAWTKEQIDKAMGIAAANYAKAHNVTVESLRTVVSEFKRAMVPGVREQIRDVFKRAAEAYKSEEGKPDGQRPIRDDYHAAWHIAQRGIMGAMVKDGEFVTGATIPTVQELSTAAAKKLANKPRDPKLVLQGLRSISKRAEEFYKEFPAPEIAAIVEYVKGLKAADLARYQINREELATSKAQAAAAPKGKAKAKPAPKAKAKPAKDIDAAVDQMMDL